MAQPRPIGLIPPHPERRPHPANGMIARVNVGAGAVMSMVDPTHEDGLGWTLNYGNAEDVKHAAISVLESFDYLLSDHINQVEAIRRLRLMRHARKALIAPPSHEPRP